jgi:hypothetical protein
LRLRRIRREAASGGAKEESTPMPTYKFEGMDSASHQVKDEVDAASEEEALKKIKEMGYFVSKIAEAGGKKGKKVPDTFSSSPFLPHSYRKPGTDYTEVGFARARCFEQGSSQ